MGNKLVKKCANCRYFVKGAICLIDGREQIKSYSCGFFELKKEININPEIKRQIVQVIELEELVHMNTSVNNKLCLAFQSLLSTLKKQGARKYGEQLTETQINKEYGEQLTEIQEDLTKTMEGI